MFIRVLAEIIGLTFLVWVAWYGIEKWLATHGSPRTRLWTADDEKEE